MWAWAIINGISVWHQAMSRWEHWTFERVDWVFFFFFFFWIWKWEEENCQIYESIFVGSVWTKKVTFSNLGTGFQLYKFRVFLCVGFVMIIGHYNMLAFPYTCCYHSYHNFNELNSSFNPILPSMKRKFQYTFDFKNTLKIFLIGNVYLKSFKQSTLFLVHSIIHFHYRAISKKSQIRTLL